MSTPRIRMLFWAREEFPTFRVDIDVLFGRELLGRGHAIDLVMQSASADVAAGAHRWHGRTVYVGSGSGSTLPARVARHWRTFWHDFKSLRLATRGRYDAIQFRDKFLIAAIGVLVARFRKLKFFYWLSFPYPEDDLLRARAGQSRMPLALYLRGTLSAWLLYRWILPRADHAFVQSAQMQRDIAAHGVAFDNMTPVPMGIDLADTPVGESSPGITDQPVTLGYLGTLNAERHIEMLVDMLAELRSTQLPVRLLLIGDAQEPSDREALLRRARQLGVTDHLEITGFLPRLEALQRMREVRIALSPFYPTPMLMSTSPTKLVEYLALGVPVVASEHPEQRAILHACRGGVTAPWGARHFARSVRWLLRRAPAELSTMGQRGRQWVEQNRTYAHIADDLERKYIELLPVVPANEERAMLPRRSAGNWR
jgi:glycosyltransferase involved in cell wall biosynthesis